MKYIQTVILSQHILFFSSSIPLPFPCASETLRYSDLSTIALSPGLLWPSGKVCAASVLTLYSNQCAIREQQVLIWSIYPWQMAAQVILTDGLQ